MLVNETITSKNLPIKEFDGIIIEDDQLSGKNIVVTRLSDMRDNMRVNILAK